MTVTSNFGTDTCEFNLHVLGWHIELVDDDGLVGKDASLALDSADRPHVAYMYQPASGVGYSLKFAHRDETGWSVEVVDDEGDVGWSCSLALDSLDLPHISYWDARDEAHDLTEDLNYAYYDGSSWHIQTVESEGKAGRISSLALDSLDRPHISYTYQPESGVMHLRYAWFDGLEWQIETVDSEGRVGDVCSLALDSFEHPHIGYRDCINENLKYAYYDGTGWHVETADSEWGTSHSISLTLDSQNHPHIGHALMWPGIRDIKYSYYNGFEWHNELLDYEGRVGGPSLDLDSVDHPHIAYRDMDASDLMYTYYDGAVWSVETIEAPNLGGLEGPSLVLDSHDRPHVIYKYSYVSNESEVRYAAYY
jgi:hypothetical protein